MRSRFGWLTEREEARRVRGVVLVQHFRISRVQYGGGIPKSNMSSTKTTEAVQVQLRGIRARGALRDCVVQERKSVVGVAKDEFEEV